MIEISVVVALLLFIIFLLFTIRGINKTHQEDTLLIVEKAYWRGAFVAAKYSRMELSAKEQILCQETELFILKCMFDVATEENFDEFANKRQELLKLKKERDNGKNNNKNSNN